MIAHPRDLSGQFQRPYGTAFHAMATASDSAPGRKNVYGLSEDMRTFPATEHKSFIKKVINVLINALPEADQVGRTDLDV